MKLKSVVLSLLLLLLLALAGCSAAAVSSGAASSASASGSAERAEEAASAATSDSGTLVVYFSATGTTEAVAEKIADQTGAALYAITPAQPYTSADLNYNDNNSRANREMNDASARPELAGEDIALDSYSVVYLGYPIWWGTAPRIVESFLDAHPCADKTVYLFCTSGSSGIEKSRTDLQALYPEVDFAAAKRFGAGASDAEVSDWLDHRNG